MHLYQPFQYRISLAYQFGKQPWHLLTDATALDVRALKKIAHSQMLVTQLLRTAAEGVRPLTESRTDQRCSVSTLSRGARRFVQHVLGPAFQG